MTSRLILSPSLGRSVAAAVVGALVATFLSYGSAAAFQITPISQNFEPTGRGSNQVFQVENDRDEPVTVTIAMAKRSIDIDGKETMQDTDDFTVFPTEVILQPKSSRVVRVKWVGDPAPTTELPYRIIAEETPLNLRRSTPGASVFLTVRYVGSIYVAPKGARHNVTVASARGIVGPRGPQLEILLENKGNRHAVLDEPALTVTAGGVARPVDATAVVEALDGENILAGGQRRILLPWPAGLPAGASITASLKYSAQ